jgi:hypothetical protein
MAKKGQAGRALGAALMNSPVGAFFGALAVAPAVPIVRPLIMFFGSPQLFRLAVLGGLWALGPTPANSRNKSSQPFTPHKLSKKSYANARGSDSMSGRGFFMPVRLKGWTRIGQMELFEKKRVGPERLTLSKTELFKVPRHRIELWTRGFSVPCSTD